MDRARTRVARVGLRRRAWGGLLAAVLAGLAVLPSPIAGAAGEVRDLLPDLAMLAPDHITVCGAPTGGTFQTEDCPAPAAGDRWLRFDSVIQNVGNGSFRVHAFRASTAVPEMDARQLLRQTDGRWRWIRTDAHLHWAQDEDGHPHWHTEAMERYRLFALPDPFPGGAKVGAKHGYCFFDGLLLRPDLWRARPTPTYSFYSCGLPGQSQDALKLTVGISVGWGDTYPWNYAGQRIDISSVPDGDYLLCLSADPEHQFLEQREGNNDGWARIRLTTETAPRSTVHVNVLADGTTPCAKQVPYPIPDPAES
ncbi:MAG: lysyl oxidase family protein [Chloroflexota bacterium]